MGKLRFKEAKGLPQGQLSRKWENRGGSLFTHLLVGSLKGSMTCRKGYVLSGIIQTVVASNPGACYVSGLKQIPNPSEPQRSQLSNGDRNVPLCRVVRRTSCYV